MENGFIKRVININLFFLRIMKEHALFMSLAFQNKNQAYINLALKFHNEYNTLLSKTTELARGLINIKEDAITDYTVQAETIVMDQTGISIDTKLSKLQLSFQKQNLTRLNTIDLTSELKTLNNYALNLTKDLIKFKSDILNDILSCKLMFSLYPSMLDHLRREAILYVDILNKLQSNDFDDYLLLDRMFWNQVMLEHAEFIRGMLDPTEKNLIKSADDFVLDYDELNKKVYIQMKASVVNNLATKDAYELTNKFCEFKKLATKGLIDCNIRSIINPLLADHVLREANHYLLILEMFKDK